MGKDKCETRVAKVLSLRCPDSYKELFNEFRGWFKTISLGSILVQLCFPFYRWVLLLPIVNWRLRAYLDQNGHLVLLPDGYQRSRNVKELVD